MARNRECFKIEAPAKARRHRKTILAGEQREKPSSKHGSRWRATAMLCNSKA